MNSQIVLYKDCELKIEKNYYIDSGLATYLNNLAHVSLSNIQYIKNQLDLMIKLDFPQETCDQIVNQQNYNYMAISNEVAPGSGQRTTYYYFIIGKTWKGQNTVQFELHMDVLATFKLGTAYAFNDRTLVHREHKDRFSQDSSTKNNKGWKLVRHIDLHAEGINPLLYRNINVKVLEDADIDYYILYRSKTDAQEGANPIDAFLYKTNMASYSNPFPEQPITLPALGYGVLFKYNTQMNPGDIFVQKGDGQTFKLSDYYAIICQRDNLPSVSTSFLVLGIKADGSTTTLGYFGDVPLIPKAINNGYLVEEYPVAGRTDALNYVDKIVERAQWFNVWNYRYIFIPAFDRIELTDPRNIKYIKYPYRPLDITNLGQNVELSYREGLRIINPLKLQGIQFTPNFGGVYGPTYNPYYEISTINNVTPKTKIVESKLWHSEFFLSKYLYDSFSIEVQFELWDDLYQQEGFHIKFLPSSTINSRFLFDIVEYTPSNSLSDYPSILTVARNNEMVLLNNSYINYIKSGFNYDVKSKNRQATVGWVTTALTGVGAVAAFASSAVTSGVGIAAGISLATSTAAGIFTTIEHNKQAEQNISARLDQLRLQSTGVVGSDDVDLMSYYCDNKLWYSEWKPSEKFQHVIWDLFYYCGYISQEQKTPQTNTRKLFNFLQCSPILDIQDGYYIPGDIQDEICRRWGMGVFIFHNNGNAIDFSFQYENWETWLN